MSNLKDCEKDLQTFCKTFSPSVDSQFELFEERWEKKWKSQCRNSEYYICSTFGVGVGRMVLIDSQVCFYHKQISILTPLTCTQFSIHRKIWSQASFSSFFWWTFYIAIVRWCPQEFLSGHNIPPNLEMWAGLYISHFLTVLAIFPEREEKPYKISLGPQSRNICWSHE